MSMKLGWGSAFYLQIFVFTLAFAATSSAQSLCVVKGGAGLRRAPSSKSPISWKVPKYMPLMGTGKRQNGLIEVKDVDGQTHWISGREVTTSWNCVVVRTKATRLRTGPGKQFQPSPLGMADKYAAFLDLGGEDGWIQIENDEGEKGWANMDHLWKPMRKTRMSFDDN